MPVPKATTRAVMDAAISGEKSFHCRNFSLPYQLQAFHGHTRKARHDKDGLLNQQFVFSVPG